MSRSKQIHKDLLHSLFLLKSMLNSEFGKKVGIDDLSMPEYSLMCQLESDDKTQTSHLSGSIWP